MAEPVAASLVELRSEDGIDVIAVRPKEVFRADVIEALGRQLRRAIEASRGTRFVLDLSAVEFLTSAALGLIINIQAHLTGLGHRFAVAGVSGEVAGVFEYTRLKDVMLVYATVEEAVKAMKA